ncbi:class I SAM-dependent methyltransferase [Brevibacillus choshinensis]|uniref:Methyltransferase domain-containing protein n=1 Tax=Brevibacillus choshinensis TaxID=54911 RepID=A0ABX7FS09_BRECH|nr:methyltransferase domain-containing protein [Brevibacillus choshinensis]QRG68489.1 methyltransferase domain-containing protein [Brevibacillus choshinensis]
MADFLVFLRRFIAEPGRVGSIAPSSRFLCERMLSSVDWDRANVIIELGPGTGAFTQSIYQNISPDTHYVLVERDAQFRTMLQSRFPEVTIREEATMLSHYLEELKIGKADVIISGLPFANFPEELRAAILDEIQSVLAPGGLFITFQYSLQLQAELQKRFSWVETNFTLLNIPPAFIYTCRNGQK